MKSPQALQSDDLGAGGRSFLRRSADGRVAESSVHALAVVVLDVLEEKQSKVLVVGRDDVVQSLATKW